MSLVREVLVILLWGLMPLILQMDYDFSWHLKPPLAVAISHRCLNNQGHPW